VEDQHDLTVIDPSFLSQLPILENYLLDIGYDIKNVKRIILTHVHGDNSQVANEIKRKDGAKIYSHWIEAKDIYARTPHTWILRLHKKSLKN
jgi:glyoxylase-like metal-dependent hydrolase (beta-lactamase superfamily II)